MPTWPLRALLYSAPDMADTAEPGDEQRLAELLRLKILASGHSQRAVERRLAWGKGYISQLLRGNFDLKVKHVYAILGVIGLSPESFFGELYRLAPAESRGLVASAAAGGSRPAAILGLEELGALRPFFRELIREVLEEERAEGSRVPGPVR